MSAKDLYITILEKLNEPSSMTLDEKHYLTQSSHISTKIYNTITCIKKIDYHDIPHIISLLFKIYKEHLIESNFKNINIINVIRFTIDAIIKSNIISVSHIETDIIEKLVNSSLILLNENVQYNKQEKYCCF